MQTHGWRGRIGLILPADNVVMEPELNALDIPGVSFHVVRITELEHDAMRAQGVKLGDVLTELGVDAAVYACAETSFNIDADERGTLDQLIAARCGKPVVTATNAMLAALRHLGAGRVSVASPYTAVSGRKLEETLAENGIEVLAALHRDFRAESSDPREWFNTNRQPPTVAYAMARGVDRPEAEAVVVASTNFATLGMLPQLEADCGKPVVTSNQSITWWCLRTLGLSAAGLPLGTLATTPGPLNGASHPIAESRLTPVSGA